MCNAIYRLVGTLAGVMVALLGASAGAVEFTTNATLTAADRTYEGADVTVNGCVVTIQGEHSFGAFTILNAGTSDCQGTNLQATSMNVRDSSTFRLAGGGALRVTGILSRNYSVAKRPLFGFPYGDESKTTEFKREFGSPNSDRIH